MMGIAPSGFPSGLERTLCWDDDMAYSPYTEDDVLFAELTSKPSGLHGHSIGHKVARADARQLASGTPGQIAIGGLGGGPDTTETLDLDRVPLHRPSNHREIDVGREFPLLRDPMRVCSSIFPPMKRPSSEPPKGWQYAQTHTSGDDPRSLRPSTDVSVRARTLPPLRDSIRTLPITAPGVRPLRSCRTNVGRLVLDPINGSRPIACDSRSTKTHLYDEYCPP